MATKKTKKTNESPEVIQAPQKDTETRADTYMLKQITPSRYEATIHGKTVVIRKEGRNFTCGSIIAKSMDAVLEKVALHAQKLKDIANR